MNKLDLRTIRRFHVYADVFLVSLAWLGAYATRSILTDLFGYSINPSSTYLNALPLVVGPWITTCWVFGIYQTTRMKTVIDQIQQLLKGVVLGLLVIASISFFIRELELSRSVVLLAGVYCLVLQGFSRAAFYRVERSLQRSGRYDVRTLILGAGTHGIRLLQKLQDRPEIGLRVVGFLDDDVAEGEFVSSCPVLGGLAQAREIITELEVEEVFVAMPRLGHDRMLALVLDCEDLKVTFRVVTDLFEVLTSGAEVDLVDDLPLVRLGGRRVSPLYEPVKRAFDCVVSTLGILALTPLWPWWALRIRLDDPGPILFAHRRIGKDGVPFTMYKFRTMTCESDAYSQSPHEAADPRITSYGRWLRKTSIDELPQLWNVLKGDMSLVGPRPEMPFIVEKYDEWERRRLAVKPGITGLWQILGRKDLPMQDNLQYDYYYIRNRSLWLDCSTLLRTFGAVLSRRGAF